MTAEIQKYNFKEGLSHEFEIINFSTLYTRSSAYMIKPHRLDFYAILWFQEGTPTHFVDFNPIKIKPNTLLFINKNSVHRFDNIANCSGKVLLFTDNFFCKTDADVRSLRSNILFNDLISISQINISGATSIFTVIFQQLEIELENVKDTYQSDILRNLLKNLLLYAERERRKQDFVELKKDENLDHALRFKDLLDKNFINHKKVQFYCEQMNLTSKKLNQATSKIFGKTPKEIITDRVLLASKRLIANTNESIKEISFSLGFEEPTNFIKYFKRHTRKTPYEFRVEHTSV